MHKQLFIGRITAEPEGIYVNPPKDKKENFVITIDGVDYFSSDRWMKLKKAKKINGIYLGEDDFGFAPRTTFEYGIQEAGKFVESGLARVLEHTPANKAEKLEAITKSCKDGIEVKNFPTNAESARWWGSEWKGPEGGPAFWAVSIYSPRHDEKKDKLIVDASWYNCAFGVLDESSIKSHEGERK